jgi:hypothetical protein
MSVAMTRFAPSRCMTKAWLRTQPLPISRQTLPVTGGAALTWKSMATCAADRSSRLLPAAWERARRTSHTRRVHRMRRNCSRAIDGIRRAIVSINGPPGPSCPFGRPNSCGGPGGRGYCHPARSGQPAGSRSGLRAAITRSMLATGVALRAGHSRSQGSARSRFAPMAPAIRTAQHMRVDLTRRPRQTGASGNIRDDGSTTCVVSHVR